MEKESVSGFERLKAIWNHPLINVGFLVWGLFVGIVWATVRDDVYLIAKAGEIIALALGRFLIRRETRMFFTGILATSLAIPIALYTTSPIFFRERLPIVSQESFELFGLGILCGLPLFFIGIWGLRWRRLPTETDREDPAWVSKLNHIFKWALLGMVLSFHIANPFLIIAGILIFLGGMICLAKVRLSLTLRHVGNFLLIVGIGTVVVSLLLIPVGIAHVSGAEAALAVVPGVILAFLGVAIRSRH
ncbi:MAG: hypothetical protein P1U89_20910 [Verrucomicrobiales bacterium]|nr:hypothetical protein [Verrucomicrobiales bacterium]